MNQSNEPWSEQFRIAATRHAELEAAASMLEECKTAILEQRKSALGDIPDAKSTRLVKSDRAWEDYIKKMVDARKAANLAKVECEYIRMKYWEEQSANANARTEMRM